MTISNESRARVKKAFEPVALGMGRLGLTPDALTLIGFAITVVGAVLVANQLWLVGGLVVFAGGAFDMFDGVLARATGRVSRFGAFLDSTSDKAGEIIVYLGLIAGLQAIGLGGAALLAAAAMGAGVMVTYTRAKSEALGFTTGSGMAAIGIMPREARLVILSIGLLAAGVLGAARPLIDSSGATALSPGEGALFLALGIIAIGATITSIQRILFVRRQAASAASPTNQ